MEKRASREELEAALRQSRRALPFGVVYAVIGSGFVWALHRWMHLSYWVVLPAFALPVSHALNIAYCRWALRRLGS
jgi:hypothetical protein